MDAEAAAGGLSGTDGPAGPEGPAHPDTDSAVQARLRGLLQANRSIVGELGLAAVLRRIVEAARDLLGVEFGALGVIAPDRHGLEEFVHIGVSEQQVAEIGHLPTGEGLLGALIEDPRPIRLHRIGDDARSVGFPEHHPPMASFLGVPVHVRGRVFGNLYLSGLTPRDFSDDDVEVVSALAATAGIAIENARLFEEASRRQAWLEHTSRLTRELLSAPEAEPLALVASTVHQLADADRVAVYRCPFDHTPSAEHVPPGEPLLTAAVGKPAVEERNEKLLAAWVLDSGTPLRRDEDGELESSALTDPPTLGPANDAAVLAVPLLGPGGQHGAIVVSRAPGARGFAPGDVETAATFAGHVSLALEVAARRRDQEQIQLLEDRARIARDLHDHVIQQLFAAGMTLQGVTASLEDGERVVLINGVVDLIDDAVGEIRTSIFHLRPQARNVGGLRATVLDTINDVAPAVGFEPQVRFTGPVDAASDTDLVHDVAAVVREALANVARHAHATTVTVAVRADATSLEVSIVDDGNGLDADAPRSGLANLEQRARQRGGALLLSAPPRGPGTTLSWRVPVG